MSLNLNFIKKLQKIVDPNHFRFMVVFYGHTNEIDEVKDFLKEKYQTQTHLSLSLQNKAYVDIAETLYSVDNGFVYIDEMREILMNPNLSSGFNQRRDKIASKNINLIMFYHKDNEKYLQRDAVKVIPDLWEFRSPIISIDSNTATVALTTGLEDVLSADFATLGGLSVESKINEIRRLKKSLTNIKSKELLANTFMQLGILNKQLSNNTQALEYYEQVLQIRVEIGDKSGEGMTINNISQIYKARGDLTKALEYLEKSLQIRVEIGDKSGEGTTLNNIATIHQARGDLTKALEYLEKSLKIQVEIGDKWGEGRSLNNISQIYQARGDLIKALEYLEKSLQIVVEIGDKLGEGTTLNNISLIYKARGDLTKALEYLEKSLKIRVEIGDKSGECASRFNIGLNYFANDEVNNAQEEWLKVYEIAKVIEYAEVLEALDGVAKQFEFENFEALKENLLDAK